MSYVLRSVEVHNICQHEDFRFDVEVGLNAVTGRNGDGKSNLLRALAYGLTGMVDGTWGSQQDLQKDGSVTPGYVRVCFNGGGSEYEIRRFSTSSTKFQDSLRVFRDGEWETLASRRQAVNQQMEEILGIPVNLMFQIMWGRQGELDHLLTAPAAYINSFLSAVFDTKKLDTLRGYLKNSLDSIASLSPDSLKTAQERRQELESLESEQVLQGKLNSLQKALEIENKGIGELEASVQGKLSEESLCGSREKLLSDIMRLESEILDAESAVKDVPPKPKLSDDQISAYLATCRQKVHGLLGSLSEVNRNAATMESQKEVLRRTMASDEQLHLGRISQIDSACTDTCELCGHALSPEEKAAYISKKVKLITGFDSREEFQKAYDEAYARNISAVAQLDGDLGALALEKDGLEKKIAEANKELELGGELYSAGVRWHEYRIKIQQLDQLREQHKGLLAHLEELSGTPTVSAAQLAELSAHKAEAAKLSEKVREAEITLAENRSTRSMLEKMISDADHAAEQYQVNKDARDVLTELRDIFSQKRAQARYLRGKIAELNERIAYYMESSQMPFTLNLNENTHLFEYTTQGGFTHPAARLSGAQRSISSVVLQMSILDVVGPRMNLFLVDEPSEALDDDNKIIQAGMFAQLATQMPDIDGTMLIVTRDEQVINGCVNNIRVVR